jgi:hypothetical protein
MNSRTQGMSARPLDFQSTFLPAVAALTVTLFLSGCGLAGGSAPRGEYAGAFSDALKDSEKHKKHILLVFYWSQGSALSTT